MQIQALTVLARAGSASVLRPVILDGRIREAVAKAELMLAVRGSAKDGSDAGTSEVAQLCGDLMLALDRAEEAEDTYRQAIKLAGSERGAVRVISCRCTGFMCLHHLRFGAAAACFGRIVADDSATAAQKTEALCALAVTRQYLGQKDRASQTLDEADKMARLDQSSNLAMFASLVRVELMAHGAIRSHTQLHDHVFWHSPPLGPAGASAPAETLAAIDICMGAHEPHAMVMRRLRLLRDLICASRGEAQSSAHLMEHLAWLRSIGLASLERKTRLDTALAAIAQRQADFARAVLEPLHNSDACGHAHPKSNIELTYCLAKVSAFAGRSEEAMDHYQRYALESMRCLRAESLGSELLSRPGVCAREAIKDDIELRLPAKYRRAYRYLQEHLDRAELSVREIADDMGVTERALQAAFKAHLGMTPGEVMQRCRVERIRADLLRDDSPGGNVIETAARWGIRNRSTLATSYRKYFRETPTETLARRGQSTALLA